MMVKEIAMADIRIDGGTQQRDLDEGVMLKYLALMKEGEKFPPVDVVHDGKDNFLWDGFHRWHCHRRLNKTSIMATVVEGTKRDAKFKSLGANAKHGFPRQAGVAKKNIFTILTDAEWGEAMSNVEIAMAVGVTEGYVRKIKAEVDKQRPRTGTNPADNKGEKADKTNIPRNEPESDATVLDSTGKEVPEHLVEVFSRVPEIKEYIKTINQIFRDIKEAKAANDILYVNCKIESLKADIGNVRRSLRFTIPYAVCGFCNGDVNNEECSSCDGRGFVGEQAWIATPEEFKKDR